jgi:hypothetical protein
MVAFSRGASASTSFALMTTPVISAAAMMLVEQGKPTPRIAA